MPDSIVLSILICTLEKRRELRKVLIDSLTAQVKDKPVEVLTLEDIGQTSIGKKRQMLLESAKGKYVCFVDDDDLVSPTYVDDILAALKRVPDATHCSLRGVLIRPGQSHRLFEHSSCYTVWATVNGLYVRPPNHLNAIRRDLALRVGFIDKSWGEDRDFSEKLCNLGCLNNEALISRVLYCYVSLPNNSTTSLGTKKLA